LLKYTSIKTIKQKPPKRQVIFFNKNMNKYYLTKEKLEELKKELEHLKSEGRKEIARQLKTAKEYGDLSENAEYSQAKDEQAALEIRIAELEDMIRNAIIIEPGAKKDRVDVGSKVLLKKDNKNYEYLIVGETEADPSSGKISNNSPLGKVLLGKKVGDEVIVEAPRGKIKYKILKIS
jgi:transcription elongation factor GreA